MPNPPVPCSLTRSPPTSLGELRSNRCGVTWKTSWPSSTTCHRTCELPIWVVMTKSTVEIAREEGRGQRAEHKARAFDVVTVRHDFPILQNDKLVYLDNAATSQKPRQVIERLQKYYETENANIHRGVYQLSQTATHEYEQAR